ncbi:MULTISPECIES: DUF2299 family protein [Acidianus]|uniref:DUF2299 domain-containing protein n=1 Tax=Candidatus Acidianus copahuensis TaxID=1160895 RepID=A0A031LKJ6_9CREN|nr:MULTISPECIES: DUF2299 family protein [Acidianus]EZQ02015.1 hypothetical protein CM19_11100 [Candidatus Acidianus copahuensis]NON61521.1 DUF2299 family protein [Acidianus sp. RZ1]
MNDEDVISLFKELGMKVEKVNGPMFFQVNISSLAGGPVVSVIRTSQNANYYIITTILDLPPIDDKTMKQIGLELSKMNIEFFLTQENENPRGLQLAKLRYAEGLSKDQMLDSVTLVKNASYMVVNLLDLLGHSLKQ